MSDLGHPTRALRDFRGTARVREVMRRDGLPREGSVIVREVELADAGWTLEVEAAWRGVPVGAPAVSPGVRPGIAHDAVNVGRDVELARAVMGAVEDELRALRTPDVQAALVSVRSRR